MLKSKTKDYFVASLFLFCSFASFERVCGQNSGFLPGDCFFSSVINEESLIEDSIKKVEFIEGGCNRIGAFGLKFGFNTCHVDCDSKMFRNQILFNMKVLRKAKPLYPRIATEVQSDDGEIINRSLNSFVLFIYNSDFEPFIHPIGLRFNEKWFNHVAFDKATEMPYNCEWRQRSAVAYDWKYATEISPLQTVPPVETASVVRVNTKARHEKVAISVAINKIKLILIPSRVFDSQFDYFLKSMGHSRDLGEIDEHDGKVSDDVSDEDAEDFIVSWIEMSGGHSRLVTMGKGPPKIMQLEGRYCESEVFESSNP